MQNRSIKMRRIVLLQPFEASLPAAFPRSMTMDGSGFTKTATLKAWLIHWLDDEIRPIREQTTYYCYRNMIYIHIIPALGRVRLCDITPRLLETYYAWCAKSKGLSANSVHKHHILLHTALKLAYVQGLLPNNPADRAIPPKETPPRQTFYNTKQAAHLLSLIEGDDLELPVKLACYLGLRRSEIVGLRWQDVDLAAGTIAIRQVRTAAGSKIVCKRPKTEDSMRTLSIGTVPGLLEHLRRQKEWHQELIRSTGGVWREDLYAVTGRQGEPFHPNDLTRRFTDKIKKLGLPKVTLHGLRHTFASVANDARVPMVDISKALGHSNPTITARIYTHVFDQTHGEVLAAVANGIATDAPAPHLGTKDCG